MVLCCYTYITFGTFIHKCPKEVTVVTFAQQISTVGFCRFICNKTSLIKFELCPVHCPSKNLLFFYVINDERYIGSLSSVNMPNGRASFSSLDRVNLAQVYLVNWIRN